MVNNSLKAFGEETCQSSVGSHGAEISTIPGEFKS